jgi:hypothetical protein
LITTIVKSESDTIVPEYQWRGEYAVALIRRDAPIETIFMQALLAASLALDVLGRE